MKPYIVDFTGVKTYWQLYEAVMKGLDLPEWFGKNADALWDVLTGYIEYPATIYLYGVNKFPKDLVSEREEIIKMFREASNYCNKIIYEVKVMS